MAGHIDLSERIIECMYEVTDRLTYHVCSRKSNHRGDEHLIIADLASNLDKNELALERRNRLQMVCRNSLYSRFIEFTIMLCTFNLLLMFSYPTTYWRN